MMRARRRAIPQNAALFTATLVVAALLAEGTLRAVGVFAPVRYHVMPPHAELRDVQTSWDVTYRTNAMGLRWGEVSKEKPRGVVRVALVGDSFIFGQGCERGAIVPDILQKVLRAADPHAEVVNVSNIGVGPADYAFFVRDIALPLDPDIVVVTVYGNDASQVSEQSSAKTFLRVISEHSHLFNLLRMARRTLALRAGPSMPALDAENYKGPANTPEGRRASAIREFRESHGSRSNNLVAAMVADPEEVTRWLMTPESGIGWRDFQAYIGEIDALCRRKGVPLILGIVPDGASVDPRQVDIRRRFGVVVPENSLTEPSRFHTLVQAFAERRGIPCFDPLAAFRTVRDGLYFETDLHWTPAGNALYAEQLAHFLEPWLKEGRHRDSSDGPQFH
jgi:lysophospholipase L1-like esterase